MFTTGLNDGEKVDLSQGRVESHHSPLGAEDLGRSAQQQRCFRQARAALANSLSLPAG